MTRSENRAEATSPIDANGGKDGFVVPKCKNATQNFRTTFIKILKRAGLKPWPKLFQNLRSTRQTELCEKFPSHVVKAWIGNSESVAKRHYLQVTENHFQKASGTSPKPAEVVATPVAMKAPEQARIRPILRRSRNEKSREIRGYSSGYVTVPLRKMGAEGLEPNGYNAGETALSESAGAHTGAIDSDFDLQGQLKTQAIEDLQKAWEALRRLEDRSVSPAESIAAGRAMAFVSRAFEELEEGKPGVCPRSALTPHPDKRSKHRGAH